MTEFYEPLRTFEIVMPSRIIFGINAVKRLASEVKLLNAQNVLILTGPEISKAGLVDKVREPLQKESIKFEVCEQVEPEPSMACLEKVLDYVKRGKFDLLIGLGGGSNMDVTKAVSALSNNPGDPEDYFAGGKKEFTRPGTPFITIPTTAGTGAEITPAAVIKDRKGIKAWFGPSPYLETTLTIVDPVMSSTMPPRLTASTGIDALAHGIETFLTRGVDPITETLALESIRLISRSLRTAVYHGKNIEARYNMALATLMEAFPEGNWGCIEGHAIGHLIGSFYPVPHGTACGVALPYAMEYNVVALADRLKLIAEAMGEDVAGLSEWKAAYKGIYAVRRIIEDVGLPTALKDIGVKKEDIPKLAENMVTNPWIKAFFDNCIRTMTKENAIKLLENVREGKLGSP